MCVTPEEVMLGDFIEVYARFLHVNEDTNATSGTYVQETRCCKVISIDGNEIYVDASYRPPIWHYAIPLTEEILRANGFVEHDKFTWIHKQTDFIVNIPNSNKVSIAAFNKDITIHYVHELQHALRICGLNELADNFKVNDTWDC